MSEHPMPNWMENLAEGFEAVVGPDPEWSLPHREGLRCRRSDKGVRCPNVAVAVYDRGAWRRHYGNAVWRPWAYCADHMWDHWIDDGVVVGWHAREVVS